jgi:dipeptidyl aminopeptidase/acylaminoacyl peptidase
VALPISGAAAGDPTMVRVLAASHHFLACPRLSPDRRRLSWLGWDHPAMPWDGTQLCVADVDGDGVLGPHRVVVGGPAEAVCQAEWDGPDTLVALTDPAGWWNLFAIDLADAGAAELAGGKPEARNLAPIDAELGGPLWRTGTSWFAVLGGGRYAVRRDAGLAILADGAITDVPVDLAVWSGGPMGCGDVVVGVAGGPARDVAVVWVDLATASVSELTAQPAELPDVAYLPVPVARTFRDAAGNPIPALVYPPCNPGFTAPDGERPPLLVEVHGGPTGRFAPVFDADIAYFTSRGFAVVAVNYGGSTGYGRAFRERLNEQWGVVDVADCATVARALADEGFADPARLAIRGGSAGGWTAAASLTTTRTYRCGTIMFPILDLTGWTAQGGQTHDFESRYVEGLVGRLPEYAARYEQRSPANHAEDLAGPVLMLQGLDDQICPPVQANEFIAGLHGTGIPHAYLTFEGEQHGFRMASSIRAALEAELSFYGQVFGFTTPGVPVLQLRH